jgi:hypothetical protein
MWVTLLATAAASYAVLRGVLLLSQSAAAHC